MKVLLKIEQWWNLAKDGDRNCTVFQIPGFTILSILFQWLNSLKIFGDSENQYALHSLMHNSYLG